VLAESGLEADDDAVESEDFLVTEETIADEAGGTAIDHAFVALGVD
jgi:hypothetical protein